MKKLLMAIVPCLVAVSAARIDAGEGPQPSPANPYNGMQERAEFFEFAEKPKVEKVDAPSAGSGQGKWIITFASKAACDATVAILDKDGKIVRHLASGVLGKNAPWPFQQNSLAQKLEWDGKDDFGKAAPAGCVVRVSLGAKYEYELCMGWSIDSMAGASFAVADDGTVYSASAGSVRAFDRNGKYLRTILPPRGGLKAEDYGAFPLFKTVFGDHVLFSGWMGPFAELSGTVGTCALTPDGSRLLMYAAGDPYRVPSQLMVIDTQTGALSREGLRRIGHVTDTTGGTARAGIGLWAGGETIQTTEQWPKTRLAVGVCIAFAPDGDTVYFSGTEHVVYRKELSEMTFFSRFGTPLYQVNLEEAAKQFPEIFLGERGKAGNDNKHFNRTTGVACDKDGNLYVGDWWNNRIQVFQPDGTFLKTLPAQRPGQIAVSRKTGEVYYADTAPERAALVKLGGLTDPAVKARFEAPYKFKDRDRDWAISPALGLDANADPPIVWFGVGGTVFRLLDKGGSLEASAEIGSTGGGVLFNGHQRLAVDPETDVLYYSSGARIFSPAWHRFDGRTGERDAGFKTSGWEDMAIGADGSICCRTGGYGRFVVRYNRDWTPRPFQHGVTIAGSQPYGGEPPEGWPADGKTLHTGVVGHSNVWQPGLAVAPDGDVYVRAQGMSLQWYKRRFPDAKPLRPNDVASHWPEDAPMMGKDEHAPLKHTVMAWNKDGNEKSPAVVMNLVRGGGIAVDARGSVYLSVGNVARGWTELEKANQPPTYRSWGSQGTVLKFRDLGGKFPLADTTGNNFKDALWSYDGHAPCVPSDCGCCHSRYALDLFGRLYIPAMHLYSVMILDSNGNRVMRLGRYGNADSRGKNSPVPDPDIGLHWVLAVAASDRALYIADNGNQRILKAALSYVAEETVAMP